MGELRQVEVGGLLGYSGEGVAGADLLHDDVELGFDGLPVGVGVEADEDEAGAGEEVSDVEDGDAEGAEDDEAAQLGDPGAHAHAGAEGGAEGEGAHQAESLGVGVVAGEVIDGREGQGATGEEGEQGVRAGPDTSGEAGELRALADREGVDDGDANGGDDRHAEGELPEPGVVVLCGDDGGASDDADAADEDGSGESSEEQARELDLDVVCGSRSPAAQATFRRDFHEGVPC